MADSCKDPNPILSGGWTIVSHRRGGKNQKKAPKTPRSRALTLTLGCPPIPWTPSDPDTDPERESNLLQRMQSSTMKLESSGFYHRFLSRFQEPQIQDGLAKIRSCGSQIQMVVYGIGSIESHEPPRLQLALALLLHRALALGSKIEVFDPVLSAVESVVMESLGCSVLRFDEGGQRKASTPTLFYMPHCEAGLYENLLASNWRPSMLNRMVVLGNSFGEYEWYMKEIRGEISSVKTRVNMQHVLEVRKYTREVGMEGTVEVRAFEVESDCFRSAFHDTSWHFFELNVDTDLILPTK